MSNIYPDFQPKQEYPEFGQNPQEPNGFNTQQPSGFPERDETAQLNRVNQTSGKLKFAVVAVLIVFLTLFLIFMVNVTKGITSRHSSKPAEQKVVQVSNSQSVQPSQTVTEATTQATEPATTPSSTATSTVEAVPSASSPAETSVAEVKGYLPPSAVSSEVLSNKAVVEQIAIVAENNLLAMFEVKFKMGATTLTLMLNYDQASGLSVGKEVTISYSKVEGYDKVIVRGISY